MYLIDDLDALVTYLRQQAVAGMPEQSLSISLSIKDDPMSQVSPAFSIALLLRFFLLVVGMIYGATASALTVDEFEPNNSCFAAQQLGVLNLPTTVTGSLDSIPEVPDIDFFQFEGMAGQLIVVDLEGSYAGAGTLSDPYLGLFNSECALLAINDDSGAGLNSRLNFSVPEEGVFILGVTSCCDSNFVGGGVGSYLMTLNEFLTITAIDGRLVDGNTGGPLPGAELPYASAQLVRCDDQGQHCIDYISGQQVGDDGSFSFQFDQYGNPLAVGIYQIQGYASGYEGFLSEPFNTLMNEVTDLGDLGLVPLQLIGSISGRLIDALSTNPLPGNVPPYPSVYLERCEEYGCFAVVGLVPDDAGRFLFEGIVYNLSPGTYRVVGASQEYQQSISAQFQVEEFGDVDIGDLSLTPLPIQFGEIQPCVIPPGGWVCEYSIEVRYSGTDRHYRGEAWSTVEFYPQSSGQASRFQVGKRGLKNPNPQKLNLREGQTETLTFQLEVPANVPDNSTVCGYISVGQSPDAQFNS